VPFFYWLSSFLSLLLEMYYYSSVLYFFLPPLFLERFLASAVFLDEGQVFSLVFIAPHALSRSVSSPSHAHRSPWTSPYKHARGPPLTIFGWLVRALFFPVWASPFYSFCFCSPSRLYLFLFFDGISSLYVSEGRRRGSALPLSRLFLACASSPFPCPPTLALRLCLSRFSAS